MLPFPERELAQRFGKVADTLTSITGFNELLLSETYGPLNAEQKRVLQSVVQQAKELCELIRGQRPQ
jgi:hypothetical protein